MAIEIMSKVFPLDIPSSKKYVLLMLTNACDPAGRSCYPSMRKLSEQTSLSINTVKRCIDWLVTNGYIQIIKKGGYKQHKATEYHIIISALVVTPPTIDPLNGQGVNPERQGVNPEHPAPPPVVHKRTETLINEELLKSKAKPLSNYLKNLRTKH